MRFFLVHPGMGVSILGAVVLAVTGAEALYADMGHFGAQADARAWFILVLPALVLELLRPGRAAAWRSGSRAQPVLPAGAELGIDSAGRAFDPGHGHRLAGGDLRARSP